MSNINGYCMGANIFDTQWVSKHNKGIGLLLCVIDNNDKHARLVTLKYKQDQTTTKTLRNITEA